MPNSVTLKGFKEFQSKLAKLPPTLKKEVDLEVQEAALNWEERAKQDAPVDQGDIQKSISSKRTGEMSAEVVSPMEYSAYIEWGTKTRVQVPGDIASYAVQFRGANKGAGKAKEMIYAWMNRVGVPPERQWIVFISIITKGIHPHPYFFIQRPMVEKQLIGDIKTILSIER